MRKNQGFAAVLPLLLLALGLGASVLLVGQRTSWFNRAAGLPTTAPVPSPWGNAAVIKNEGDLLVAPPLLPGEDFTIEGWFKYEKTTPSFIFVQGSPTFPGHIQIGTNNYSRNTIYATAYDKTNFKYLRSAEDALTVGNWYHVALVYSAANPADTQAYKLFLNGKIVATAYYGGPINFSGSPSLTIGGNLVPPQDSPMHEIGEMDEVRISNTIRYSSDFSIESGPFRADGNTLALFHFDNPPECDVRTGVCYTTDSSGRNNQAIIKGLVKFVPSTIPVQETISHNECKNNACVKVDGAGTDLCQSSFDCLPVISHTECKESACVRVTGPGKDACKDNTNCQPVPATHTECQNKACVTVAGPGKSSCITNADCTSQLSCRALVYSASYTTKPPYKYGQALSGGATLLPYRYYLYGLEVKNLSSNKTLGGLGVTITEKSGSKETLNIVNADRNCTTVDRTNKIVKCGVPNSLGPGGSALVSAGHVVQIQPPNPTDSKVTTIYDVTSDLGSTRCAAAYKVGPVPGTTNPPPGTTNSSL